MINDIPNYIKVISGWDVDELSKKILNASKEYKELNCITKVGEISCSACVSSGGAINTLFSCKIEGYKNIEKVNSAPQIRKNRFRKIRGSK